MHDTVLDHIKQIFPFGTDPEAQKADSEGSTLRARRKPTAWKHWRIAPWYPTDLFAVTAYLLDAAGALVHFDPDPDAKGKNNGFPRLALTKEERAQAIKMGSDWVKAHTNVSTAATPKTVQDHWRQLIKQANSAIREASILTETPNWWKIALILMVAADEASECVGTPADGSGPVFWEAIRRRKIRANGTGAELELDVTPDGEAAFRRSLGSSPTFAMLANSNIVNVFPKSRVSMAGCSLRNFSRHLALLPKAGSVRCNWHMPAAELLDDDDLPIDILVIPFPFKISARNFQRMHEPKSSMEGGVAEGGRPGWANFCLAQEWLLETDIVDLAERLLISAKKDVESVNAVILPEYALDFQSFTRLCGALKKLEPNLEFVISGTSDNCDPDHSGDGNHVMTCVWHQMSELAAKKAGLDTSGADVHVNPDDTMTFAMVSSRKKHHRWMLSTSQLETYALTSTLDPRINWWENHDIGLRELHFHPFRKNSLFTAMICEDLARSDPCHEVLRSVAPNLVFVLLMDGPQIPPRWSARYASTLSDDPGCSVLTLTSYGLIERSNRTRMFSNQEAVAYFSGPFGQTPIHLSPKDGAKGVLITLTSEREQNHQTIDGRRQKDSRGWRLTSTQPVVPHEDRAKEDKQLQSQAALPFRNRKSATKISRKAPVSSSGYSAGTPKRNHPPN